MRLTGRMINTSFCVGQLRKKLFAFDKVEKIVNLSCESKEKVSS